MQSPITPEPIRRKRWLRNDPPPAPRPWCWPLPRISGHDPIALRTDDHEQPLAVDIGYSGLDLDAVLFVPVYAAQDGLVRIAGETATGYAVTLDHDGTRSTHYAHLERMFVAPQSGRRRSRFELVRVGTVLGHAAKAPVHVRFAMANWTDDRGYVAIDPLPHLRWTMQPAVEHHRQLPEAKVIAPSSRRSSP